MPSGKLLAMGMGYSVTTPDVVTLATLDTWPRVKPASTSQRLPSGPAVMPDGQLPAVGKGYSVKTPAGVTLATKPEPYSVNQRLPSGPAAMPDAPPPAVGMGYSVKTPAVVTLATLPSVNQRLPSGPAAMKLGPLSGGGRGYSVISPMAARALPVLASALPLLRIELANKSTSPAADARVTSHAWNPSRSINAGPSSSIPIMDPLRRNCRWVCRKARSRRSGLSRGAIAAHARPTMAMSAAGYGPIQRAFRPLWRMAALPLRIVDSDAGITRAVLWTR